MSASDEEYHVVSHNDASGRMATPPRPASDDAADATPKQDLNDLGNETMLASPSVSSPRVTGVSDVPSPVAAPAPQSVSEAISSAPAIPESPPEPPVVPTKPRKSVPKIEEPSRPANTTRVVTAASSSSTSSSVSFGSELCSGCNCDVTKCYHYFNWEDPVKTGMLCLTGLVAFFVFGVLRVRLYSAVAHVFLFAGVATGLIAAMTANNVHIGSLSLERLQEPLRQLNALPDKIATCVQRVLLHAVALASDVLMWSNPIRSLKVLAGVWLLSHHCCCVFGKLPMFLAFVTLFTFPAVHTHYKSKVDGVIANLRPQLNRAADYASQLQQRTTLVNGVLVAVLGAVLWIVFFSLSSWITLVSLTFLTVQTLPHLKPKAA